MSLPQIQPSRGGLADVLQIIVRLNKSSTLQVKMSNYKLDIQDFFSESKIHGSIS